MQVAEILPMLLRLYDPETLAKYDSLTPTTLGQLADYADAVQKLRYTVAVGAAAADAVKTMIPNAGATSSVDYAAGTSFQQYVSFNNNTLGYDQFRTAGSSHYHRPRGSLETGQIFTSGDQGKTTDGMPARGDTEVYATCTVLEPCVPHVLAGCDGEGHHPGFYGIKSLNITANFATVISRAWQGCRYPQAIDVTNPACYNKTATLVNVGDTKLTVAF